MGDDREIARLDDARFADVVARSKNAFLEAVYEELAEERDEYNLEREFARTRHNRSLWIPLVVALIIVVLGGAGFFLARYIEQQAANVAVGDVDFEDINLQELLDRVGQLEQELARVRDSLARLDQTEASEIQAVTSSADRQIRLLQEGALSPAARAAQQQAIRAAEAAEIGATRERIGAQRSQLQERETELVAELEAYDSRRIAEAREQEEVLANERRLFALELANQEQLYEDQIASLTARYEERIARLESFAADLERTITERYERDIRQLVQRHSRELEELRSRFNPVFDDPQVSAILAEDLSEPASLSYDQRLAREGILDELAWRDLVQQAEEIRVLIDEIRAVGFSGSIPLALDQMESRATALLVEYQEIGTDLADRIDQRDREITRQLQTISDQDQAIEEQGEDIQSLSRELETVSEAVAALRESRSESAYLIGAGNPESLLIYTDQLLPLRAGTTGTVYRDDETPIARISVVQPGVRTIARVTETLDGQMLRPFDAVVFDLGTGTGEDAE